MSAASAASMKSKWLKAFKSLKTPPPNGKEAEKEKRNGKELNPIVGDSAHQFQEYTYKKITPCDVCSQVLRGHTRQGLKCRLCKLNVHIDCQERAAKCQTKSRLLRRQKSSSEIETRGNPPDEEGPLNVGRPRPGRSVSPGGTSEKGRDKTLSRSVTFREPEETGFYEDGYGGQPRRRRLFGMRSFMFGQKSQDRAASLPETEQVQYAAGYRPFGQPLVFHSGPNTPSTPNTPSPRSGKRTP